SADLSLQDPLIRSSKGLILDPLLLHLSSTLLLPARQQAREFQQQLEDLKAQVEGREQERAAETLAPADGPRYGPPSWHQEPSYQDRPAALRPLGRAPAALARCRQSTRRQRLPARPHR